MKAHYQSGHLDASAKSMCSNQFCVQMAFLDATGRADGRLIASARPIAPRNSTWTLKSLPGKSLAFASRRPAENRETLMDLGAIFGLDSGSAIPPRSSPSQGLKCSNTPPANDDADYEAVGLPRDRTRLGTAAWQPGTVGADRGEVI
jgi:hypothetical protein